MQTAVFIWSHYSGKDKMVMHSVPVHIMANVRTNNNMHILRLVGDNGIHKHIKALFRADVIHANYEYLAYNEEEEKEAVIVDLKLKDDVQVACFDDDIDLSRGLLSLPVGHFGTIRLEKYGDGTVRVVGIKEMPNYVRAPF